MPFQRWNGSSFVTPAAVKRWNGSSWVDVAAARRWDGAAWVTVFPVVKLTNTDKNISDIILVSSPASGFSSAGLGFRASGELEGQAQSVAGGTYFVITPTDEWMQPLNAGASSFEIRATTAPTGVTSTNGSGGSVGVTAWTNLSAGRRWQISASRTGGTPGNTTADSGPFTIEIRDAVTLRVVASCTASLRAEVEEL